MVKKDIKILWRMLGFFIIGMMKFCVVLLKSKLVCFCREISFIASFAFLVVVAN